MDGERPPAVDREREALAPRGRVSCVLADLDPTEGLVGEGCRSDRTGNRSDLENRHRAGAAGILRPWADRRSDQLHVRLADLCDRHCRSEGVAIWVRRADLLRTVRSCISPEGNRSGDSRVRDNELERHAYESPT